MSDRVLIKAALNGASGAPAPLAPEAAAEEGRRAVEAGAAMVHVHARTADGAESSDPAWYAAFLERFSAMCSDVPVSVTTKRTPRLLEHVRAWQPAPEVCSVNMGSALDPWQDLLAILRSRQIAIEAGAADFGMLDAVNADAGKFCQLILLVEADGGDRFATARRYLELRDHARARKFRERIVAHGRGDATWGVVGTALACGDHVRVGLEDARTLASGEPARSNGDLVANAVRMAEALGRVPLEPKDLAALKRR